MRYAGVPACARVIVKQQSGGRMPHVVVIHWMWLMMGSPLTDIRPDEVSVIPNFPYSNGALSLQDACYVAFVGGEKWELMSCTVYVPFHIIELSLNLIIHE